MNKQRRKKLSDAFDKLTEIMNALEEVKTEEEESYENLPDSLKHSPKGEEMDNYIAMMEEAYGYLDDANAVIEDIKES